MKTVVVVSHPEDWALREPGVLVVTAEQYLRDSEWSEGRSVRVFNLCRRYRHQSLGYYVSLLAAARGHTPFPSLSTILDMRSRNKVRIVDEELEQLIHRAFKPLKSSSFTFSVYFGANMAARYEKLALALFNRFPAPILRAQFVKGSGPEGAWRLSSIVPVPAREIPDSHQNFAHEQARQYFRRPRFRSRRRMQPRWDLAILHDPKEELRPSEMPALKRFVKAAEAEGMAAELIQKDDFSRLAEFDALFIRETTGVGHHTFRFAKRAEEERLIVIDDAQSILRCGNKVFLAEAMRRAGVPIPETIIAGRDDLDRIEDEVGLPCVLKHPESSFSVGVVRCDDREQLETKARHILADTDLLVAQAFVPTEFDWRIGVLDGEPLWACRYHMAKGHWQIIKHGSGGSVRYGATDTVPMSSVPKLVVRTAIRAAKLVGDGLYGVDLKSFGDQCVVMEVNDNPNLDVGCEDLVLGEELYRRVIGWFVRKLEERTAR